MSEGCHPVMSALAKGRYTTIDQDYRWTQFASLLMALTHRNVVSRYRKSILGPAWAVIQPVGYMLLFIFLRGVTGFSDEGIPYPIFTFAALVPWTFFSNAVVQSAPSALMNANVIKKIAAPREVFPLSAVMTALFDFATSGAVLVGFMIWYQIPVGFALLWLPLLMAVTALLAFAVGMFLASLGTFKRDLIMAAPFLMQLWLFTSPIMYPLSQVPEKWRSLYIMNPVVGLIEGYRNVLLKGSAPPMESFLWSVAITAVMLLFTWPLYRWMSKYFTDVM